MNSIELYVRKNLRFNIFAGMMDAAFFGLAWGFGSFGTIIPLFFSQMTDSAILIGLIPAIHAVGWQLPQLFTAGWVSRMRRYKPAVMLMTIHERIPFLGLALAAWLLPVFGAKIILPIAFLLLIWQGVGAGFTANPWQSMIAKIIPSEAHGTFFGVQAAVANIVISGSAIAAGYLLDFLHSPLDFVICFLITSAMLGFSYGFLALTREPEDTEKELPPKNHDFWAGAREILRKDANFRWFLAFRVTYQFATMGFAFYIVYGLRAFAMDEVTAGFLTATLTISQTVANAGMGWLGDRLGHRSMLIAGAFAVVISSAVAWFAPSIHWFYLVFIMTGLANVSYWTIGMAMTVQYGTEAERPVYIGLSNTLIAPATIFAPILGGWIADAAGYTTMFALSALGGLFTTALLLFLVRDPRKQVVPVFVGETQ
ncbi:MAG: MFS transporter [Chloroflexi bacterium]|nr:MAG: MFS transporter [Chloroflexota bacterium]